MTTVKTRHRRLEARRARRRGRQVERTPRQQKAKLEYKERMRLRGYMNFTSLLAPVSEERHARIEAAREARKQRADKRWRSQRRPLSSRRLELMPLKNGMVSSKGRRHKWRPEPAGAPRPVPKRMAGRLRRGSQRSGRA